MELTNLVGHHLASALSDRSYDTRLSASLDISKRMVNASSELRAGETDLVGIIKTELLSRSNANSRKGGLMLFGALCRASKTFGDNEFWECMLHEASYMLDDEDSSVRFAACECLYNAMSTRVITRKCFEAMFDCLCKIESDAEIQASAASFDRALRELVVGSHTDTDMTGIFQVIESRILYPHNYIKQLSTGWLGFLRANCGDLFAVRLCKIVPALLSCLSHCSVRDIEVSVDSVICQILLDLESGLLRLSSNSSEDLMCMLVKYARLPSSLSIRSRVLLFDFFRVVSPTISSPEICAESLASVLACLCDTSVQEDVRSAVLRANVAMMTHQGFVSVVKRSSEFDFSQVLSASTRVSSVHLKHVVPWIHHMHSTRWRLTPAECCKMIRTLWLTKEEASKGEISKIIEVLLEHAEEDLDVIGCQLARVLESTIDAELWHSVWTIISEKHRIVFPRLMKTFTLGLDNSDRSEQIILSVTRVLVGGGDSVLLQVCDDIPYMSALRELSPVSFIIACVSAKLYKEALNAFAQWHDDRLSFNHNSLTVFVDLFESELMYDQRKSLLTQDGRLLVELLTNIAVLAEADAPSTRVISSRLHLASIYRSI